MLHPRRPRGSRPGLIHLQTGCPVQPRAGEGRGTLWKEPRCNEDGSVASVPGSHSGLFTGASPGRLSLPGPGRQAGGIRPSQPVLVSEL